MDEQAIATAAMRTADELSVMTHAEVREYANELVGALRAYPGTLRAFHTAMTIAAVGPAVAQ
ncbi:MAG TPA: hypothetical protein PKY87_08830 [Terricaulis sp.]|nr:hypothetical protein [Terricaulis sp.]